MLLLLLPKLMYLFGKLCCHKLFEISQLHLTLHAEILCQNLQILCMLILQSVYLLNFLRDY